MTAKKRPHRETSKAGETFIAPFKQTHKEKIIQGLETLKVGGTQEELSKITGLREDQVWKRMVDLVNDDKVFDTGITRKLKSGLQGIVWQLKGMKATQEAPVIEKKVKPSKQIITNQQPIFNL